MNTNQACNILGVSIGASVDEVKKAFKKKAAEYHPDRNKEKDAEAKFKTVNEAYQLLEKHGTHPPPLGDVSSEFYNHGDHLAEELRRHMESSFRIHFGANPFRNHNQIHSEPIIVSVDIPFEMSITGGKKEITYERTVKCELCADGSVSANKIMCQKCGGHGKRTYGAGDKELPCNTCKGTGYISQNSTCSSCGGSGTIKSVDTLRVTIPSGVENGLRLILKGRGHYRSMNKGPHGQPLYDNVIAVINVIPDHDMQLSGNDVISVVELSLLEALKGTKKKLRTVRGEKTLAFKPKTKNRDTVKVAGFGVPPHGAHTFIVNVSYPEDVSDLIKVLENKDEPEPEEISGVQS